MNTATRTALLILALTLGSSVAHAQDSKPGKGKTAEKAPKKDAPKADAPDVTYLDLSGPPDAPESDLPEITKKGSL